MVLVQKWPSFLLFFLRQDRPGKFLLRYSRTNKMPFQALKTRSSKSRKIDIFLKELTHAFGPKIAIITQRASLPYISPIEPAIFRTFFLANIGQENVFYDILERKNAFLGNRNKKFKKSKIDIFLKWLTHGFGPKMGIFPTFFFQARQTRKMSFTIF